MLCGDGWHYSKKFVDPSGKTHKHEDEIKSPVSWATPDLEEVLPDKVRAREARRPGVSLPPFSVHRQLGQHIFCMMQKTES